MDIGLDLPLLVSDPLYESQLYVSTHFWFLYSAQNKNKKRKKKNFWFLLYWANRFWAIQRKIKKEANRFWTALEGFEILHGSHVRIVYPKLSRWCWVPFIKPFFLKNLVCFLGKSLTFLVDLLDSKIGPFGIVYVLVFCQFSKFCPVLFFSCYFDWDNEKWFHVLRMLNVYWIFLMYRFQTSTSPVIA